MEGRCKQRSLNKHCRCMKGWCDMVVGFFMKRAATRSRWRTWQGHRLRSWLTSPRPCPRNLPLSRKYVQVVCAAYMPAFAFACDVTIVALVVMERACGCTEYRVCVCVRV